MTVQEVYMYEDHNHTQGSCGLYVLVVLRAKMKWHLVSKHTHHTTYVEPVDEAILLGYDQRMPWSVVYTSPSLQLLY